MGRGGMSEVFRARVLAGPRAGWTVAIKRLLPSLASDPANVEQFAHEADVSRYLDHPNIVRVLEVGVIEDVYFMVMEMVDGRDVGQILKRCRQKGILWPVDFAVYAAKALLDALAYAHQATGPSGKPLGIVHCDVSPSNLFVSRTGDLKLGDFGVARAKGRGGGELIGKPYYFSPEALDGQVTPAADLWSATVTLYEMLTLERPFTGKDPEEVFAAIRGRLHTPVRMLRPEASEELEALIERNFSLELPDRFQNAAEYAAALGPLFDERIGTPLAISAMVRGLFGATEHAGGGG
ncbi:MAG: serine/threonine protein kinase [Myxococcales bacterium]|nr:serine/threonine protein kinase [Myxococcales bacterium]